MPRSKIVAITNYLCHQQHHHYHHHQVIRRDIARTYPEHALFKQKDGVGQEALFNVMKAYSVHDREVMIIMVIVVLVVVYKMKIEVVMAMKWLRSLLRETIIKTSLQVGYCQGSAFIVGLLLMQVILC